MCSRNKIDLLTHVNPSKYDLGTTDDDNQWFAS